MSSLSANEPPLVAAIGPHGEPNIEEDTERGRRLFTALPIQIKPPWININHLVTAALWLID